MIEKTASVMRKRMPFFDQELDFGKSLVAFSFDHIGANKKKTPRIFRRLRTARRLTQPPPRHLLKKVDENFHSLDFGYPYCSPNRLLTVVGSKPRSKSLGRRISNASGVLLWVPI